MKNRLNLIIIVLCAAFFCPCAVRRAFTVELTTDFAGMRFRCGDLISGNICLPVLLDECSLRIVSGKGIPRQAGEKLILTRGSRESIVAGAAELRGCVSIASGADAIEYLRFFSTSWMAHFFHPKQMEIFQAAEEDCGPGSCLPPHRWKSLGMELPTAEVKRSGFEVTRYVVRRGGHDFEISGFRVTEFVTRNGKVSLVSEEPLQLELEDQARLVFVGYL